MGDDRRDAPPDRAEIEAMIAESVEAVKAMSPVDRELMHDEQRRSFVRGETGRDPGPGVLAEEVRRLRAALLKAEGERDEYARTVQSLREELDEAAEFRDALKSQRDEAVKALERLGGLEAFHSKDDPAGELIGRINFARTTLSKLMGEG